MDDLEEKSGAEKHTILCFLEILTTTYCVFRALGVLYPWSLEGGRVAHRNNKAFFLYSPFLIKVPHVTRRWGTGHTRRVGGRSLPLLMVQFHGWVPGSIRARRPTFRARGSDTSSGCFGSRTRIHSSSGRASASQAEGGGFETRWVLQVERPKLSLPVSLQDGAVFCVQKTPACMAGVFLIYFLQSAYRAPSRF